MWLDDCLERISKTSPNVIVALGEEALRLTTNKTSISKWHLSILEGINGKKVLPLMHPEYIMKIFKESPFLIFGGMRAVEESHFPEIRRTERKFLIRPSVQDIMLTLDQYEKYGEYLSLDIETGAGQISCIGFSIDPREAICIPTLPRDYTTEDFFIIWQRIEKILKSKLKKIGQNIIYDASYLSRYGFRINNIYHDTMIAQKFLHPELPMGLDTVARIYTKEPYWKDEGKNWNLNQNIDELYYYNCKDVACTLEAALAQKIDLKKRNLEKLFYEKQMPYSPCAMQMSWQGLLIDQTERARLREDTSKKILELETVLNFESTKALGETINPRSPVQVKKLLLACGYRIPFSKGKESSNKEALMKLRLKDPESKILTPLIRIAEENKKLSSFIDYQCDADNKLRYTLYNAGTESMRWSCGKDPWDRGLNAQTIPAKLKSQFIFPEGKEFIEVDLKQAESRFVAWDGPVLKLMEMYNEGIDVHRFVAAHPLLFNKPMDKISKDERQLGKKVGHAGNYGMGAATLSNTCLKEMDLVLSQRKAEKMLEGYHVALENGVRRWQKKIEEQIKLRKFLDTPLGYQRYFYDRICDTLFKEAYAYRPQNTVVTVINHLMLFLFGKPHVTLVIQIHDSLGLLVDTGHLKEVLALIKDQDSWNPRMQLAGGEFRIPIEIKRGLKNWAQMETLFEG